MIRGLAALAFRISSVIFILLFCLLTSCRKHMAVLSPLSFQVRIDSARVLGFNHIKVSASYSSGDLSSTVRLDLCWGATDSLGYGSNTPVLCKTDLNGNLLWEVDLSAGPWSIQRPMQLALAAQFFIYYPECRHHKYRRRYWCCRRPTLSVHGRSKWQPAMYVTGWGVDFSELVLMAPAAGGAAT